MRKTNVTGIALDLKHNHFTATQYDLLDFFESLMKSSLGDTEQGTPTPQKILTSKLTYSNGTLSWTAGWCVIDGKIRKIFAGTQAIDQNAAKCTYYFVPNDAVLSAYDYKRLNVEESEQGCVQQTVTVASDLTDFYGFDINNQITICGRSDDFNEEQITDFANRYYNFSRINDKNQQEKSQTLDGISPQRRYNGNSVQTFYIEVSNWDMSTDISKTVTLPSHIWLFERNISVMASSFHWVADNNDASHNSGYDIQFYETTAVITMNELQSADYYSSNGFRGVLKVEAYSYCHVPE